MHILRDPSILNNILLRTDSYKASHYLQLPEGHNYTHSYIMPRGGEYDYALFYGLQYYLIELLSKQFTQQDIEQAAEFYKLHGEPFNRKGFEDMLKKHNGFYPIRIRAVKEGTLVPIKNVLVTIESTDDDFAWAVGYLETLLVKIWYPITVATRSHYCKEIIKSFLEKTSDNPEAELPFKLHCFGYRGVSSEESAGIGNSAHLVSFLGSDTIRGIIFANFYYGVVGEMAGFSIPAAEHFTITSYGRGHEDEAYMNMIRKFGKPGSIFAVVSDSEDLWNAITNIWGKQLRQAVIDCGATVVIRPDSGEVVPTVRKALKLLDEAFGHTVNSKGYKVLNYVRLIQGDGINPTSLRQILEAITEDGYSTTNIAFGMGGGLLQQVDRDTMQFAMKASCVGVYDELRNVSKSPVDDKSKKSLEGQLELVKRDDMTMTVKRNEVLSTDTMLLEDVWNTGVLLRKQTFDEVRAQVG